MPITLGSNIPALLAQRRLSESTQGLRTTFERLSSGLRINHAADDAAGLAVSESLKADTRVYVQSVRNFNDGLSLLNVADSAIDSLSNIVIRIKELAEQASNGVYGAGQRAALDKEAQKLSEEYFRIASSTRFNDLNLFSGSFGSLKLQGGYGQNGGIAAALGGAVGNGSFTSLGQAVGVGSATQDLESRDLNGDGILDLVGSGADGSFNTISVSLGNGDGSFRYNTINVPGTGTRSDVTLGDVNGDGIFDIVAAGSHGGPNISIDVLLGNGDGTFSAAQSYVETGIGTLTVNDIALADVNSDGLLDLGYTGNDSAGGRYVAVRLGQANGTFGARSTSTVGLGTGSSIKFEDLNGDNVLDMIAAGNDGAGRVDVRLGNGDGTFRVATTYANEGNTSTDVSLADLNSDGILDMVSGGFGGGSARVTVRLGNGNGTFGAASSYAAGGAAAVASFALGDLSGDGILDLISLDTSGTGTLRFGNGDGSFGAATAVTGEAGGSSKVLFTDANGDGVLDFLSAGTGGGGVITVRLGNSTSGVGKLLDFSLRTRADALGAIAPLDRKLSQLSVQRGIIGAFQSRVATAVNTLQTSTENFQTAYSRITDADTAEEAAKLVKGKILQQAATAVLTQANSQPKIALTLLKDK